MGNQSEDSRRLYIGNLAYGATEREIRDAFMEFVGVENVEIMRDRGTNVSRGFGFITLKTVEEVAVAIEALNGREIGCRAIRVSQANPKPRGNRANHGARA